MGRPGIIWRRKISTCVAGQMYWSRKITRSRATCDLRKHPFGRDWRSLLVGRPPSVIDYTPYRLQYDDIVGHEREAGGAPTN